MRLSKKIAERFEKDLEAILQREINEKEYMAQADFNDCIERATAIIHEAKKGALAMLGVAIAQHRQEKHGEDRSEEIELLSASLDDKDMATAKSSWWNF